MIRSINDKSVKCDYTQESCRAPQQSKRSFRTCIKAGLAVLSVGLTGCMNMYEPPTVNDTPIQVKEEAFLQDVPVADVDDGYIEALARHYRRHGSSTMDLLITYDPHSKDNTAMNATNEAADIAVALREKYGVTNVEVGIMPIASQDEEPRLLVSYDSLYAQAPAGCDGMMPGLEGRPLENDPDYKLGCSIDTLIARQVAHPADLLGQGESNVTSEGRSAANIVDVYRSGAQNPVLGGENASGD
ncbi:MAG: hypothetical protein KAJ40_07345 [Alphaproteobacteria bacterium]|nr:hypothetical protein [Alphaproteobacteria bacterium]